MFNIVQFCWCKPLVHYAEIVNYLIWYNCPTLILIIPKLDMI